MKKVIFGMLLTLLIFLPRNPMVYGQGGDEPFTFQLHTPDGIVTVSSDDSKALNKYGITQEQLDELRPYDEKQEIADLKARIESLEAR